MGSYLIAFHGTNWQSAEEILHSGFRQGTYFAYRIENAARFGGPHIFAVRFLRDQSKWRGESDGWQFHLRTTVPASEIVWKQKLLPEKKDAVPT